MRLIDAEHLKKRATNAQGDCWDNYGQGTADFLEYIDKEPTVDAEPVVLCKKCNRFERNNTKKGEVLYCYYHEMNIKEDDFCSWGERKEDETN